MFIFVILYHEKILLILYYANNEICITIMLYFKLTMIIYDYKMLHNILCIYMIIQMYIK